VCGICGAFGLSGPLDTAVRAALPAMATAISHRGPDGQGLFCDDRAALGHRRLAIIDRARGHQPIANEDGTKQIVFNGEIYNHKLLRADLERRGHRFRTDSDTEVILHSFEEFGDACLDRLEGMFAFVIYDQLRGELFAARDRLGKKPFYFAVLKDAFHFGSEIKAIAQSPLWDDELAPDGLEGYLSLGYFLAPATIYRHVRVLEPGHWLRVRNGRVETRQYWDVARFDDDARDAGHLQVELDALLKAVVNERLESEVPLGAFLSGGLDSGLVVSYMSEAMSDPVNTTTVGFGDAAHDETGAAGVTARHLATRHYADVVEPRLEDVLDPVVRAFDQPFADSSAIPAWYVSAMARRHVTVALTGDGGDEVFGGYDFRYVPHALEARARVFVPGALGRTAMRWLGRRWPTSRALPRALRLSTILANLGDDAATAYYSDLCFAKPHAVGRVLGLPGRRDARDSAVFAAVTDPYRRCPSASAVQRAQYADLKVYLPNDVLVKVDRMSMQHGLEIRCPLLDRRVVEFGFRVPTSTKMPGLESKHLLRRLARERLPAELLSLPKRGFTAPVGAWIAGPYAGVFADECLGTRSFVSGHINQAVVRQLFAEHGAGKADHSYLLWAVWVLERWGRLSALPLLTDGAIQSEACQRP
jgi:asparagine synthase (glutamine-hydrolysing)